MIKYTLITFLICVIAISCSNNSISDSEILPRGSSVNSINTSLSLPWVANSTWSITGGPHCFFGCVPYGSGGKPYGGLDFSSGTSDTSVRAMADGVFGQFVSGTNPDGTVNSKCGVIVDSNDKQFSVLYYHMASINSFTSISRQAEIGRYGSFCGKVAGIHVHIALLSYGTRISGGGFSTGGELSLAENGYVIGGWKAFEGLAYQGHIFECRSSGCSATDNSKKRGWSADGTISYGQSVTNDGTVGLGGSNPPPPPPDQPPAGYTKCADEEGTCNINVRSYVIFGAQTSWTTPRDLSTPTACNVATFGDPIPFTRKSCYSKPIATPPPPPNQPPSNARQCATEGGRCNFSGTYDVWYGNNSTWITRSYSGGVDCTTSNFGGTDPLPGVQKVCKTLGPDAPPPPLTGQQIRKARSNNLVMDWDGGILKLWTNVPTEGNQFFIFEPHIRGDMVMKNVKNNNTCLEFPDNRVQNMKANFVGCNKDDPKQQIIFDRGNYLGYVNGVHEWKIRPRGDYNWCLSVNGSDTQGTEIVWQRDSCDQPQRRWSYDGISPPARWSPNPNALTLTTGVVGGAGASNIFTLSNNGGAGPFKITSSNAYFAVSPANSALDAGASINITVSAGACPSAGTQSGVVTIQESDNTATLNVSRTCDPAPTSWSLNPANLSLPEGTVGGTATSGTFAIINNGGAGNYAITSSNTTFTVSPTSGSLGTGISANITVSAGVCAAYGVDSSDITISGGGSSTILKVSRFCNNPPSPIWTPNPTTLNFTDTVGGGAPLGKSFLLQNTGTGSGNFSITTNNTWIRLTGTSGTLAAGASQTIGVEVTDCTLVGNETGSVSITGDGSSATLNVSRSCTAVSAAPAVPTGLQVTMSSGGRIFVAWSETSGASYYEFKGTFDGQNVAISGQAPALSNPTAGAIATFLTAPDAADKQGKQVCLAVRAVNSGGLSAYTNLGCTTYQYYTMAALTRSGQDERPRLTINR
jgi:hypothetical protein